MSTSRRNFLRGSLATVSAAVASRALVPSFTYAQAPGGPCKNVVQIFLGGGPDSRYLYHYQSGPVDAALRARRPNLSIDPLTLLTPTGFNQNGRSNPIGFHPNFASLINQVNTSNAGMALITEFGTTENATQSHEIEQNRFHDATLANSSSVAGWMGRVAQEFQLPGLAVWGINGGYQKFFAVDGTEKPFLVSGLSSVTFNNRDFGSFSCTGLRSGGELVTCGHLSGDLGTASGADDSVYLRDVLKRLQDESANAAPLESLMASTQKSMFQAVPHVARMMSMQPTVDVNQFRFGGADDSIANSCADIARAIRYLNQGSQCPANVKASTKLFATQRGGWDSHRNQANDIPNLIGRVASAIKGLVYYLDQWGLLDETIIVAYGEFGRTCAQNGSVGTDHASAGHCLVVGGSALVGKGAFGPEASLSEAQNSNAFTAQVPQTGILRAILSKAFNDPAALDRIFIEAMPGSVPGGWLA